MVAIGLLLLVLTVVVAVVVALANRDPNRLADASAFGISLRDYSLGELFLAGAVTGLLFGIGLSLLLRGLAKARRQGQERKRFAEQYRSEVRTSDRVAQSDESDRSVLRPVPTSRPSTSTSSTPTSTSSPSTPTTPQASSTSSTSQPSQPSDRPGAGGSLRATGQEDSPGAHRG